MRSRLMILAAALAMQPLVVQAQAGHPPDHLNPQAEQKREAAAVKAVLARYQAALERLDATGTEVLFTPHSAVFETGGSEGTYANYLAHHLRPSLPSSRASPSRIARSTSASRVRSR